MLFVTYNKSEKSTSEGEAGTTVVDSRNLNGINGENDTSYSSVIDKKKVEGEKKSSSPTNQEKDTIGSTRS